MNQRQNPHAQRMRSVAPIGRDANVQPEVLVREIPEAPQKKIPLSPKAALAIALAKQEQKVLVEKTQLWLQKYPKLKVTTRREEISVSDPEPEVQQTISFPPPISPITSALTVSDILSYELE